jgi:hypothetical protein
MSNLRDAAQQALKSLRGYRREIGSSQPCDAERALEAALEQPEQPVAWKDRTYGNLHHQDFGNSIPLYTHPPRREWRGLTDTERAAVQYESFKRGLTPLEFMELHEAALRSKNHD